MRVRSLSKIGAVLFIVSVAVSAETLKPCTQIESRVLVTPSVAKSGTSPRFALELANKGRDPVRLIDVRKGRRTDLADAYYELVVCRSDGAPIDGPRQISDPGPISETDFFLLAPGAKVSLPLRSLVNLDTLSPGTYVAYVSVWMDPYSVDSRCRSNEAKFRIQ